MFWSTLILLIFCLFKPIYAINEFSISQDITYTINKQGSAFVKHQVTLTNNFSQIYAQKYQINLVGSNIVNISGSDAGGNIIDQIDKKNDQTKITLKFSNPIVGKNQQQKFNLNYSIPELSQKKGSTWEIQLPGHTSVNTEDLINISLEVPSEFGNLSFSSIPIENIHTLNQVTWIQFNQKQLKSEKVLFIFGNHQLFDFKLSYFLQNDKNYPVNIEIPIPPDTNSQNIILKKIEPLPIDLKSDIDGNWLAQFTLPSKGQIDVTVDGQANIHPPTNIEPKPDKNSFTSAQKYWPTTDQKIIEISQKLQTPKDIYDFVVTSLNYNYNQIDTAVRKGAIEAINNSNHALCTEFTDLFVTLARSKNIPSREIEGFAYSNNPKIKPTNTNSDVLHAWPEYFDQKRQTWIEIDPTWEKTTNGVDFFNDLDLNHLAFVIHGAQSDYPPPPGSYKINKNIKSVFVDFAKEEYKPKPVPLTYQQNKTQLIIRNPNLFTIHSLSVSFSDIDWQFQQKRLLPLEAVTVNLPKLSFLQSLNPKFQRFQLSVNFSELDSPVTYPLVNKLHYFNLSICIGLAIFLLCLGGIIISRSNQKK